MPRKRTPIYKERFGVSGTKDRSFYRKLIHQVFSPMKLGEMLMILPNGEERRYGQGQEIKCTVHVHSEDFFKKCVLYGDVGFGESYVDGDWDTPDITRVIQWMILNVEYHPTMMADDKRRSKVNFLKTFNKLAHQLRENSLKGSRKNIAAHYDLSNEFFKTFLDSSMAYSSAYFKTPAQSLHEAQLAKFELWCQKLRLKPSDHVLEIGSGWGGFAMYAAKHYGCHVTGITISKEQYDYSRARIKEEGLTDKIDIRLEDYRHMKGQFDKIISIEMIEAVGDRFLNQYFAQFHKLLKKDGVAGLQMIISPDHRYDSFRKNVDWIQKHIFPGSLLPSTEAVYKAIRHTGTLALFDWEDVSPSYARTLALWRDNFNRHSGKIKSLGFDEAFIRKWNYYFSYCEGAFSMRNIAVVHAVLTRPNNYLLV